MRFTPARLSAIDSFVADLSQCLPDRYDHACKLAIAFMRSHAGRGIPMDEKLFHGDPSHLENLRGGRTGAGAFWAYFPTNAVATENLLSDDEARSLCELLSSLPAFVLDGITGHRRKKLIEEMVDLCNDYLELRRLRLGGDSGKKSGPLMPDNPDVRDLCAILAKRRQGKGSKSLNQIAREFTKGNAKKADSLLRQARRFRRLWDRPDR